MMLQRQRLALWTLGGLAALVAVVGLILVPVLLYPALPPNELKGIPDAERRVALQQAQAQLQQNARSVLLQTLGGVVLVVGAIATWRQVHISRHGQITDRITKAVDQLGSEPVQVRLGGIFSLERVARNSHEDRVMVAAILAAFIRTQAPWPVGTPNGPVHPTPVIDRDLAWQQAREPDVAAALTVLGRRATADDERQLYLSYTDLRRAHMSASNMIGRWSGLICRHANLAGAWLESAQLDRADLSDTDLREANLAGAHLKGASLRGAHLQAAKLREADLSGANLTGANLDDADLTGVRSDQRTVWPAGFDIANARSFEPQS